MNVKRFLLAALAVFVTFQVTDYIVHMLILSETYASIPEVWRPDMMDKMYIMYITGAVLAILFTYIFAKGYQGKGIMEGVRYGLVIGLLMTIVGSFNQYAVYPLPYELVLQWFLYGLVQFIIAGIVVSLIYKPKA